MITKPNPVEKLQVRNLIFSYMLIFLDLHVMVTRRFTRWTPGVGIWLVIEGAQAMILGMLFTGMGIYTGWIFYLKKASKTLPDWRFGLQLFGVFMILFLVLPALTTFATRFQSFQGLVEKSGFFCGIIVLLFAHEAIQDKIKRKKRLAL